MSGIGSGKAHSSDPVSLLKKGHKARQEERLEDARAAYEMAVNLARTFGDTALLAEAVMLVGKIERDLGETEAAIEHYQEAAALIRSLGDPLALAHTIRHVADILREAGRVELAGPYYDEALILYRGNAGARPLDVANALRGAALLKADTGHVKTAIALWREAGVLYEQVGVAAGVDESRRQIARLSSVG